MQRSQIENGLALHAERLAAGRDDANVRTPREEATAKRCHEIQHVFAIIEDDEYPPFAKNVGRCRDGIPPAESVDPDRSRDRLSDDVDAHRCQIYETNTALEVVAFPESRLDCQTRLAQTSRSPNRDQARVVQPIF